MKIKTQQEQEAEANNQKMRDLIQNQSVIIDKMRFMLVLIQERLERPIPTREDYFKKLKAA